MRPKACLWCKVSARLIFKREVVVLKSIIALDRGPTLLVRYWPNRCKSSPAANEDYMAVTTNRCLTLYLVAVRL